MLRRTALALCCAAGLASAQPSYELVVIGSPSPLTGISVDVNADGSVIGTSFTSSGTRGFHFSNGVVTLLSGPPGFARLEPTGIADDGSIVGWWSPSGSFVPQAIRWQTSASEPAALSTLGGADSGALAVSPDGAKIGGYADPPRGGYGVPVGFRGFTLAGAAPAQQVGSIPVGHWSSVSGMTNGGIAVGDGGSILDASRAIYFDPEFGPVDLGTLGGLGSRALAVNAQGEVVGTSDTGAEVAGAWVEHAFVWSGGVMRDLAPLPGFGTSWGTDINDGGDVVGHSIQRVSGAAWTWRATLWVDDQPVDLNTLIAPGSGAVLERAEGINNQGWIVGQARVGGQPRPFLLKPLP